MVAGQAVEALKKRLEEGGQLAQRSPEFVGERRAWAATTAELLRRSLGSDSPVLASFEEASAKYGTWFHSGEGLQVSDRSARNFDVRKRFASNQRASRERDSTGALEEQLRLLENAIEILEEAPQETVAGGEAASSKPPGDKVFVVHGHDEEALTGVKGFLDNAGLESIVLRDEPNKGQTIIEKFLEYSEEVGFAIVLLTPDDIGGGSSDSYEELRPRARQNVIFELGFFIGKLGRERVCALFRQDVEIPSDYKGVLFVEFDERGKWREEMIREMSGAGFLKGQ